MSIHRLPLLGHVGLGVALTLGMLGCGEALPQTHPVKGKLVVRGKAGNLRALIGGRVRLLSTTDKDLSAVGEIEDGGTFAVGIVYKGKPLTGVPAGQYQVRIDPPDSDEILDQDERGTRRKPKRAVIHPKYLDFARSGFTVTVPTAGEVIFTLDPPP